MDIPWRAALLVVAAAFIVFLLAKLLPSRIRTRGDNRTLAAARARVRAARTDRERAEALCDAASAAMSAPFGATRAAAYFMRAMRADPLWPGAVDRAREALVPRRARLFRRMLWRRLAAIPWDAEHAPARRALLTAMLASSKAQRSGEAEARVLERLLAGEPLL
ncbi:MAG: hypothetical protein R3B70_14525 [Polyangiaceae bacterium]